MSEYRRNVTKVYKYSDEPLMGSMRPSVSVESNNLIGGVNFLTSNGGCWMPDDEIPGLISALQNYMSQRAKAITAAAKNGS